jgi:hypothetical protein
MDVAMVSEIVVIDKRLDQLLVESPAEAIRLILQEYQIAYNQHAFVAALASKLVVLKVGRA